MGLNVAKEVAAMERMTVPELRARYAEVFGEECRSRHEQLLVKRIAWRLQTLTGGDLSERARMRAAELANDADLRLHAPTPKRAASAGLTAAGTLVAAADNHRKPVAAAARDGRPETREGASGPHRATERPVVPTKPRKGPVDLFAAALVSRGRADRREG